ncbi:hypothetical protein ACUOFC_38635, partial [Escherichia sp. TWPC-MK]
NLLRKLVCEWMQLHEFKKVKTQPIFSTDFGYLYRACVTTLYPSDEERHSPHYLYSFQSFTFYRFTITCYQCPALQPGELCIAVAQDQQHFTYS